MVADMCVGVVLLCVLPICVVLVTMVRSMRLHGALCARMCAVLCG